jgi:hypothetical protein
MEDNKNNLRQNSDPFSTSDWGLNTELCISKNKDLISDIENDLNLIQKETGLSGWNWRLWSNLEFSEPYYYYGYKNCIFWLLNKFDNFKNLNVSEKTFNNLGIHYELNIKNTNYIITKVFKTKHSPDIWVSCLNFSYYGNSVTLDSFNENFDYQHSTMEESWECLMLKFYHYNLNYNMSLLGLKNWCDRSNGKFLSF